MARRGIAAVRSTAARVVGPVDRRQPKNRPQFRPTPPFKERASSNQYAL
jgi:hypothetical protein